jgi:hypothetical protein
MKTINDDVNTIVGNTKQIFISWHVGTKDNFFLGQNGLLKILLRQHLWLNISIAKAGSRDKIFDSWNQATNRAKMWINCSDEGSGIISCSSHNITLKKPRTDRTAIMTGTDTSSTSSVFSGVDEVNIYDRYLSLL